MSFTHNDGIEQLQGPLLLGAGIPVAMDVCQTTDLLAPMTLAFAETPASTGESSPLHALEHALLDRLFRQLLQLSIRRVRCLPSSYTMAVLEQRAWEATDSGMLPLPSTFLS